MSGQTDTGPPQPIDHATARGALPGPCAFGETIMTFSSVCAGFGSRLWRLVITPYDPDNAFTAYVDRAITQEDPRARVTVAVPSAAESRRVFGVDVAKRGIQPVWLRIANLSPDSLRLQMVNIDPRYFTPLEAAGVTHFSIGKRLSAFGAMSWLFYPLLMLVPLMLVAVK